jgi:ATP-dependent DNA helicase RecG
VADPPGAGNGGEDSDARARRLVVGHLAIAGSASRQDIEAVLDGELGDGSDVEGQARRLTGLLTRLRREGLIRNQGTKARPDWVLARPPGAPTATKSK